VPGAAGAGHVTAGAPGGERGSAPGRRCVRGCGRRV